MRHILICFLVWPALSGAQPRPEHNLVFSNLPTRWDEGFPLGNGWLGALIWSKEGTIRLALDRSDLWDLRPMPGLDRPEFTYKWVAEQVTKKEYGIVQQYFDAPYEQQPGPTKIPGAALEFPLISDKLPIGTPKTAALDIRTGLVAVILDNGLQMQFFIHPERQEGWFRLDYPKSGSPDNPIRPLPRVRLLPPAYAGNRSADPAGSVEGDNLARLGYQQGTVREYSVEEQGNGQMHYLEYNQSGWGGFEYQVVVAYGVNTGALEGVWSISSRFPGEKSQPTASKTVQRALRRGFERSFREAENWWACYWARSSVYIPDTLLERQYYREMYKFGCLARIGAPMISLQGVWTADNGRLPPWKGDFHHDLNTQMSYWPAYTANHSDLALAYLQHLERNTGAHRRFTQQYFGTNGLCVPGVETLAGEPMGGWIQYACSPTTSAWLAHHFYLQWQFSRDRRFLKRHAWPWLKAVALHLEQLTCLNAAGVRVLPLSSSPEFFDNSMSAWFPNTWTTYDLALARFVFEATQEVATALEKNEEAARWKTIGRQLPGFSVEDPDKYPFSPLKIAPGLAYRASHRHFSHLLPIYPLALFDRTPEKPEWQIMRSSLELLDSVGTSGWTGYSFAWLACLRAQVSDGDGAREALHIFATAFVSPNSFHLNGDQLGRGYSSLRYRPFTLEGNFAFAAGLQEMLLQSHGGVVAVFPAIPAEWLDLGFKQFRAAGAYLVDAEIRQGRLQFVRVHAEKAGILNLELPGSVLVPVCKNGSRMLAAPDQRRAITGNRILYRIKMAKGSVVEFK
ncbi:MAG: hypothetical protein IPH12_13250 [Saprospirales bacterium]|nr:hypothetical protein [Saprospirales bacterium]